MKNLSILKEEKEQQYQYNREENSRIWESKKVGAGMFAHLEKRFEKPTTKANSERASLIEPFVKKLQASASGTKYKPLSKAYICSMMAYIPTEDLHMFYQKLNDSPNFGAIWNWYCVAKDLNKK